MIDTTEPLTAFQQRLLGELREVADARRTAPDAAPARVTARPLRTRRLGLAAAAAAVLAGTVGGTALVTSAGPAFAVDRLPDGQLQVTLGDDFSDAHALARALEKYGLSVTLAQVPRGSCKAGVVVGVSTPSSGANPFTSRGESFLIEVARLSGPTQIDVATDGLAQIDGPAESGPADPADDTTPTIGIITARC